MELGRIKLYETKQPAVDGYCEVAEKSALLNYPLNAVTLPMASGLDATEFNLPVAFKEVIVRPLTIDNPERPSTEVSLGQAVVPGECRAEHCNKCILDMPNGHNIMQTILAESQIHLRGRTVEYEIER